MEANLSSIHDKLTGGWRNEEVGESLFWRVGLKRSDNSVYLDMDRSVGREGHLTVIQEWKFSQLSVDGNQQNIQSRFTLNLPWLSAGIHHSNT